MDDGRSLLDSGLLEPHRSGTSGRPKRRRETSQRQGSLARKPQRLAAAERHLATLQLEPTGQRVRLCSCNAAALRGSSIVLPLADWTSRGRGRGRGGVEWAEDVDRPAGWRALEWLCWRPAGEEEPPVAQKSAHDTTTTTTQCRGRPRSMMGALCCASIGPHRQPKGRLKRVWPSGLSFQWSLLAVHKQQRSTSSTTWLRSAPVQWASASSAIH